MSYGKLKKCGEFMEKDGIVVKRPGKRFVCPTMPAKMRLFYPLEKETTWREREDIDQMNALKEKNWQNSIKNEYLAIRRLYYFQQLVRFIQKTSQKIGNFFWKRDCKSNRFVKPDFYACVQSTHIHD